MNPRQMQSMMRKMGIQQVDIPATEVIIKTPDKDIIIKNPQVAKVNMMGQQTFQILGDVQEIATAISEEDIKTIMDQTNCTREEAIEALKQTNDLAEAILKLNSPEE